MQIKKMVSIKNGKKETPLCIIIHNPNDKTNFDTYYADTIVKTIKQIK